MKLTVSFYNDSTVFRIQNVLRSSLVLQEFQVNNSRKLSISENLDGLSLVEMIKQILNVRENLHKKYDTLR